MEPTNIMQWIKRGKTRLLEKLYILPTIYRYCKGDIMTDNGYVKPTFFEPNEKFWEWFEKFNDEKKPIFDAGCGNGNFVEALFEKGYDVVGVELEEGQDIPLYPIGPPIIYKDCTTFDYPEGSIVFMCRPNRGEYIHQAIKRAIMCGCEVLYVGLEKHWHIDTSPIFDWLEKGEFDVALNCERAIKGIGNDDEYVFHIRKQTLAEQLDWKKSMDITEKIPVDFGAGEEFVVKYREWNNEPSKGRTKYPDNPRQVSGRVDSWAGSSIGAVHYYGYLEISRLGHEVYDPEKDEWVDESGHSPSGQPKHTEYISLEVEQRAKKDIYSFSMYSRDGTGKNLMCKKGKPTHQFEYKKEAFDCLMSEFERLFGEGWILTKKSSHDPINTIDDV